jgi:hypothetical protein
VDQQLGRALGFGRHMTTALADFASLALHARHLPEIMKCIT